jgi:DNA topoisomerase-3
VQTPTLAMVVDRFKEIENFKPQPYWELQTLYRDTLLVRKDAFEKEDGELLANKVRKVILKLFLSKERTAMSLHQNF